MCSTRETTIVVSMTISAALVLATSVCRVQCVSTFFGGRGPRPSALTTMTVDGDICVFFFSLSCLFTLPVGEFPRSAYSCSRGVCSPLSPFPLLGLHLPPHSPGGISQPDLPVPGTVFRLKLVPEGLNWPPDSRSHPPKPRQ